MGVWEVFRNFTPENTYISVWSAKSMSARSPLRGEKKPSMLRRCVGHGYGERMMYMVTMVTEGRCPLFCNVLASVLCIDIAHEALPAAMWTDGLLLTTSSHSGRLKFVSIIYSHNSLFLQWLMCMSITSQRAKKPTPGVACDFRKFYDFLGFLRFS